MTVKVLQVYKDYFPVLGGCEYHVRTLSQELVRRKKLDVTVVVTSLNGKTTTEYLDGVKVIRAARIATVASTPLSLSLLNEVRKQKADITHLHLPYPLGDLAYMLARPSRKLVVTYHSDVVRQKHLLRLYEPLLRRVLSRADAIIVETPNYVESSKYLLPFKDKCAIVPTGVDIDWLDHFDDERAQAIRQQYKAPILFFVGRFRYYKGLHYLLEAMRNIDARLLLCGSGPEETALRSQVEREGLHDKVVFLGSVGDEDLPTYYRASDVFVFPACDRSESYGISMIQGMVCGLPAVCTEIGTGTTYVNQDGVTGLVVPPRDPRALAGAIQRLLADDGLRQRLGAAARARARREFSLDAWIDRTAEVYNKLRGVDDINVGNKSKMGYPALY